MSEHPRVPIDFDRLDPEGMIGRSASLSRELGRRRSVRDFDPAPIPREVIQNALAAAGSAPSGANLQPWHFVVVTDPKVKQDIRETSETTERGFYAGRITEGWRTALEPLSVGVDKPFLEEAPALIVIFRRNHVIDEAGDLHKTYYPMESVGIATGILIATLHLSGVATLPYTPSPMGFLNGLLGRPDTDHPFLILAIGYPREGATVPAIVRRPPGAITTWVEAE